MIDLLQDVKVRAVSGTEASAGTAINGDAVDMSGFENATFIAMIGTVNAGNYLKIQEDDDSAFGTAADLAGTKVVFELADKPAVVQIVHPVKRYLRAVIIRAGVNTAASPMVVIQGGAKSLPCDNVETNVIISETHISPVAGTP